MQQVLLDITLGKTDLAFDYEILDMQDHVFHHGGATELTIYS